MKKLAMVSLLLLSFQVDACPPGRLKTCSVGKLKSGR